MSILYEAMKRELESTTFVCPGDPEREDGRACDKAVRIENVIENGDYGSVTAEYQEVVGCEHVEDDCWQHWSIFEVQKERVRLLKLLESMER